MISGTGEVTNIDLQSLIVFILPDAWRTLPKKPIYQVENRVFQAATKNIMKNCCFKEQKLLPKLFLTEKPIALFTSQNSTRIHICLLCIYLLWPSSNKRTYCLSFNFLFRHVCNYGATARQSKYIIFVSPKANFAAMGSDKNIFLMT